MAWLPWDSAANPPVRMMRAVSTLTARSIRKRGSLDLDLFTRTFCTLVFLDVPAAKPTPRLFTLLLTVREWSPRLAVILSTSDGCDAEIRDLIRLASIPSSAILPTTCLVIVSLASSTRLRPSGSVIIKVSMRLRHSAV